jgi:hypothetical protein
MPEMCLQNAPRGPPAGASARALPAPRGRARARLRASEGALTDGASERRCTAGAPGHKALWEARQRPRAPAGYPPLGDALATVYGALRGFNGRCARAPALRPALRSTKPFGKPASGRSVLSATPIAPEPATPAYGLPSASERHSRGLQRLAKRRHAFEQRGGQVSAVERRRVQERLCHVRLKLLARTIQEHRGPSALPLRQSEDGAQRDILGRIGGRDKRVVRGGQKRLLRHGRHRPGPKERTSPRDSTGDAPVKRTLPYARGHWRTLARERTRVRRFTFLMIHVFRASRLRWRRGGAAARRAIHVFGDSRFSRPLGDSRFSGFTFFGIHVFRDSRFTAKLGAIGGTSFRM